MENKKEKYLRKLTTHIKRHVWSLTCILKHLEFELILKIKLNMIKAEYIKWKYNKK